VRNLLDTVISTRYFSIALTEQEPSYYVGHLDSERINAETALYVAVQAEMQPVELVQAVPMRFKIGAPDDVKNSVLSSMPGVRLAPAPQVPAAIPVRPGTYYFSVEPRGALYDRMLQAKSVMIYAPSGMPDLKLELIAVTS
jgi:type VI secretion system protein ImpJ